MPIALSRSVLILRRTVALAALLAGIQAFAQPIAQPELSDQVLTRPGAGLTATLPVGATRTGLSGPGASADSVILPGMAAIVNISDRPLTKAQTLGEVSDSIIRDHLASVSSTNVDPDAPGENKPDLRSAKGSLLGRETREINGFQAQVFYLQVNSFGGEDAAFGYAVFMPTPNLVAMFELQTTAADLPRAKPYFELMVNSTTIQDPTLASERRAMGVEAGAAFLQQLTPGDYEAVIKAMGDEWRYDRFYRPAASGADGEATELGYRRTKFAVGTRGDLKTDAERGNSRPEDRQRGYLVFQEARILDADKIYDVTAAYFVTPDRSQEMWTIRQAVKSLKAPEAPASTLVVETGVRDRADLTISRVSNNGPAQTIQPGIEGVGYISRAEVFLLPYLLMRAEAPGDYRFYAFNQATERATLRVDSLAAPTPERKTWEYTSRPSETSPPQVATYDSKMELVIAERGGGVEYWEPITLRRLFDLWQEKGLPLK